MKADGEPVSDPERNSSRQPGGASLGAELRLLAAFVLGIVTLGLSFGITNEAWGEHRILGLAGAAVLAALLALRFWWLRKHGPPAVLRWSQRHANWLLTAWVLILAGVILGLVIQDQLDTRDTSSFRGVMERIGDSDELADRLGRPIRPGWWVSGGQVLSKLGARWDFEFIVSGPKGSGRVAARGIYSFEKKSESVVVTVRGSGEKLELVKPAPARGIRQPQT